MNKPVLGILVLMLTGFSSLTLGRTPDEQTPPMGWNSWNHHGKRRINEQVLIETIDAMVDQGLRDAGYCYVVIDGDREIWAKKMENGRMAVLLLNRSGQETVPLVLDGIGLGLSTKMKVRDVYGKKDLGVLESSVTRPTPAHGCQLFILSPTR